MIVCKLNNKYYDKEIVTKWLVKSGSKLKFEEVDIAVDADVKDAKFEDIIDGVFSRRLYDERKQREYENYIETLIREQYTLGQELAILRQRDTKQQEFEAYNTFVENCKNVAKTHFKRT